MLKKILLNIRDYFMESDEAPEILEHELINWGALGFVYGLLITFFVKYKILYLYYSFPNAIPLGGFLGLGIGMACAYWLNRNLEKMFNGLHTINFYQNLRKRSNRLFNKSYLPYLVLALSTCGYLLYSSFVDGVLRWPISVEIKNFLYFQHILLVLLFLGLFALFGGSALFLVLGYKHKLIQENISYKIGRSK